jgi:hypothetical protein
MNLTEAFLEGYHAQDYIIDNPYLWSSPCWLAFDAGGTFAKEGGEPPLSCKASRGYSLRFTTKGKQWQATPGRQLSAWYISEREKA